MTNNKHNDDGKRHEEGNIDELMQVFRTLHKKLEEDPSGSETGYWLWLRREYVRRKNIHKEYPEYKVYFSESKAHALYNEKYPSSLEKVNSHWKAVRNGVEAIDPLERLWTTWGYCEECGYEGVLNEIGLTLTCDNPKCEDKVRLWYEDYMKFRTALNDSAEASFSRINPVMQEAIREEANENGVPVLQEWVETLIDFSYEIEDKMGVTREEAILMLPKLVDFLEKDVDISDFFC